MTPFTPDEKGKGNGQALPTGKPVSRQAPETSSKPDPFLVQTPQISLPKGGGSIKSIDEKFKMNAANGTASLNIPIPVSAARNNFGPGLSVGYNSGAGNGIFGLGWNLSLASISRKTDKGLPRYDDETDSDTYLLTEAEDLVPLLRNNGTSWEMVETTRWEAGVSYIVKRYIPRIESSFARVERWKRLSDGRIHWRTVSTSNITGILGRSPSACIADPLNPLKIFRWLPELSYDDKGNCTSYHYKPENLVNVPDLPSENHRHHLGAAFTNTYLEKIQYGTKTPYDPTTGVLPDCMFETVFDYNEAPVDLTNITAATIAQLNNNWSCRKDAFSEYKACFEIRTARLCHRILHFHHFGELGPDPYLVGSLEWTYQYDPEACLSFPEQIHSRGYKKTNGIYSFKEVPPIQLTYQPSGWDTTVQEISPDNLTNLPLGIDDKSYQWIDLYSEGISGILTEQGAGWFYKSNLGGGEFEKTTLIAPKPSFTGLQEGHLQWQELEADGRKFIVSYDKTINGYFELTEDADWLPFRNFLQTPGIDPKDPNVKFIDLNGDGKADILISEDEVFCWYASRGTAGYDDHRLVRKEWEEEKGPVVVFASQGESIMLADMNGDGLTDIVRVRNGEIIYWPNMGYGHFGAKVTMDNAPWFDTPDLFNTKNIRLADINGSGSTDLVYIMEDTFNVWFNANGNSWGALKQITGFPPYDQSAHVTVLDLLGHGTSCIVWSSPLSANEGRAMRYIDLMGGKKPFVLTRYENNMGKRVSMDYRSSTTWYLEDKKAGKPWITKLPFPVQCVAKITTEDLEYVEGVLSTRFLFTQSYSYHHGYYDYREREFRGFGRVEQTDTEDFGHFILNNAQNVVEQALHQPPVKTITWYHTGACFNREKILDHFEEEYTKGPLEFDLPEPVLPAALTAEEWPEAIRACKGMMLRQEVYALDGSPAEALPYTAAFHTCFIKKLQPKSLNKYAVFFVNESQAITYNYERNLPDPRIGHTFNLEIDDFGHVLKSASIVYGRKLTGPALPLAVQEEQQKMHILITENDLTNYFDLPSVYRLHAPAASRTYELTGVSPLNNEYFTSKEELLTAFFAAPEIGYEQPPTGLSPQKRMIEHVRTQYLNNDLINFMPPGQVDTLGFTYQAYKQAFTPELVNDIYNGKVTDTMLQDAGYVHLSDLNWWVTSGRNLYLQSGETASDAAGRFYMPVATQDPLGHLTTFTYAYGFILTGTEDALQNRNTAEMIDYRTMQAVLMKDLNDNLSEILTDELGLVIATAVRGTETDGVKGDDPLSNYVPLPVPDLAAMINNPHAYLQGATSFFHYDFFAFRDRQQPCCFVGIVRETHVSESGGNPVKVQLSVGYSSGLGQNLQSKVQAEPGIAFAWQNGQKVAVDTTPGLRWITNGRKILNNKGNPVKQYEPFFSTTYEYESEKALVEIGFTAVNYYDAIGRNIRTEFPDGTLARTVFDSWQQQSFDANDTVLESPWYADRGSPNPAAPEPPAPHPRAAWLAAQHAGTPALAYSDSLGRTIYTIADNGADGQYATRIVLDIENNQQAVIDARNNTVIRYKHTMLGQRIYQDSADTHEKWTFHDLAGNTRFAWDSNDRRFRTVYDELNRPIQHWLIENSQLNTPEKLTTFSVYGENQPNDKLLKLRGKMFRNFEQSGRVDSVRYDFKGNSCAGNRWLTNEFKETVDWNVPDPAIHLGNEIFSTTTVFDAMSRPIIHRFPDGSRAMPVYNESSKLEKLDVFLNSEQVTVDFIKNIDYNAKGQRERIVYGNNTASRFTYDERTFRLIRLLTTRNNGAAILQDLQYTYDPVGNITEIRDEAQQTIFFNNAAVVPHCKYYYDAIYRLKKAYGREHAGQNAASSPFDRDKTHGMNGVHLTLKGDMNAMQVYEQLYEYDEVGNMLNLIHNAGNGGFLNRYTRTFNYTGNNNQLENTTVSGETTNFSYDDAGNMLNLRNGAFNLSWNFANHLKEIDLEGGGKAYYVYDVSGQRVRKVIENGNLIKERIYLGDYEIYRERLNNAITLQRETLHVMDDTKRIALVETRVQGTDNGLQHLIRYQYSNHLGTSCLELSGDPLDPEIISYEEYYPYGSTACQAMRNQTETAKRYRFTGKERDEESGLYYHGARYYAPWLIRWTAADPIGIKDGPNSYLYVSSNPISLKDQNGFQGDQWNEYESDNPNERHYEKGMGTGVYARQTKDFTEAWKEGGPQEMVFAPDKLVANKPDPPPPPPLPPPPPPPPPPEEKPVPFDPMADRPFIKWLLYGKDTPVRDFLTNDTNLKYAQYTFSAVAVVAGSIATGGAVAEYAAVTWGLGSTSSAMVGGGAAGLWSTFAEKGLFENRMPTGEEMARGTGTGMIVGGGVNILAKRVIPFIANLTLPKSPPPTAPPPIPEVTINYTPKMATSPSDANFLRINTEWAQSQGPLVRGVRHPLDASYRATARRSMVRAGEDLTDRVAMHPLDSVANPFLGNGIGTTYYFGNASVNSSFGAQLGNALNRLGIPVGGQFTVRFTNFPSYTQAPPMAPPASSPNLR